MAVWKRESIMHAMGVSVLCGNERFGNALGARRLQRVWIGAGTLQRTENKGWSLMGTNLVTSYWNHWSQSDADVKMKSIWDPFRLPGWQVGVLIYSCEANELALFHVWDRISDRILELSAMGIFRSPSNTAGIWPLLITSSVIASNMLLR